MPNRAARSLPAASITARTSSIPSSRVATPLTLSERPVPRLSNRISRLKELKREKKRARAGLSPSNFEIRDEAWNEDDVEWAVPDDLKSHPDIAAPRVTCFRLHTAAP